MPGRSSGLRLERRVTHHDLTRGVGARPCEPRFVARLWHDQGAVARERLAQLAAVDLRVLYEKAQAKSYSSTPVRTHSPARNSAKRPLNTESATRRASSSLTCRTLA